MPTSLLALDVSSVCVGWSLFHGVKPVAHGKYLHKGKAHGQKLAEFEDWLVALLERDDPEVLVVEAPYAGRRRFAFGVLMMYYGVVQMAHIRWRGKELPSEHRMAANQVKRLLHLPKGATHTARKIIAIERINQLYGMSFVFSENKKHSDDDTADSMAVARAYYIQQGHISQEDG
ncbi:MAG: hypothetical protein E4H01_04980 [Lysobacterales bacterium]|nr:MAG: hypothetical protein E4H01_04980 [Xanthomonadales bacterium]